MKRITYISAAFAAMFIITPARAMLKCFKNPPYSVEDGMPTRGSSAWQIVMGDTLTDGVALCVASGNKLTNVANDATHCICRAVSPYISEWFSPDHTFANNADCVESCSLYCTDTYWQDHDYVPMPMDGTSHTECPTGWLAISNDELSVAKTTCPTGTVYAGAMPQCKGLDTSSDIQECGMYIQSGGSDETGQYEFEEPCAYTE